MSINVPAPQDFTVSPSARVAIVAARFNGHIVKLLLDGCTERFDILGLAASRIDVFQVPGAFELPLAAKLLGRTQKYAAIVCLGCVVRGGTPHFDYVAGECARGIQQVGLELSLPVIFGVLTTNTEQQALDRTGGSHGHAGERAADAAMEMMSLASKISISR